MRLWSLSPKYLDTKGLLAVWREGLLAQSVLLKGKYSKCPECKDFLFGKSQWAKRKRLGICRCKGTGKIKTPYWNHPQLYRFKVCQDSIRTIGDYLLEIANEAEERGYKFNKEKIKDVSYFGKELTITKGQLEYEFEHLSRKLYKRDYNQCYVNEMKTKWRRENIEANPLFKVIEGDIESWEKIKE